ncbi:MULTISPECIES: phosphate ABC transporter permease PstA [unclassified Guyparkeria]|uniref:phosphate ABC transporter permease PstA n=1 Tax=unclassified Guyparkeria TaxID=2626246 RepID=UPI0007337498|nr:MULTISPECIES: phosphate ABC transporter permease PstA [unclassified Guyparkeria]KTG16887.1 phosphate ABC transporter permease [Guyparkeria sp. XI15]OAE85921.1 phosphate ABC transporter permease [Guyparkeria sp. WRN-7]
MAQSLDDISRQLKKRHRKSARMKWLSMGALIAAAAFLVLFLVDMLVKGLPAFQQAYIQVEINYSERASELPLAAVEADVRELVSRGYLRLIPNRMEANPDLLGTKRMEWVLADDAVDQHLKGRDTRLRDKQVAVIDRLVEAGNAELRFNTGFFTNGDSKLPEMAGLASAAVGSVLVLIVTLAFAFPVGVMTAVYLEEFAPDNRFTRFLEININNLAAIPSILFGLLGLAIFINFFGAPRSSALAGGLTLGLMTLPIIIITSRAALRAVPDSIRQAAFGVGATRWQTVRDHVLPLSMPGILTGSIIGLAQALGETAPLIIIGMIAYIPDAPGSFTQAATVLPAQIFTWAGMPESAYVERTAAGIIVLLSVLITLNATAVYLRKKFEHRW